MDLVWTSRCLRLSCSCLAHHQILSASDGIATFRGKQGEAIGRPGIATVSVEVRKRQPVGVRVGGNATIVFKTEIVI